MMTVAETTIVPILAVYVHPVPADVGVVVVAGGSLFSGRGVTDIGIPVGGNEDGLDVGNELGRELRIVVVGSNDGSFVGKELGSTVDGKLGIEESTTGDGNDDSSKISVYI